MPDFRPDAESPAASTADNGLSWHVLGTALAATAVGLVAYVGFSAVHLADMVTPDTESAISADAPLPPTAYVAPARSASATPEAPATHASAPESGDAEPSRNDSRPPKATAHPSKSVEPAGKAGGATRSSKVTADAPVASRKQQLEIKHATWADRQIATMLRTLPPSPTGWFTGGSSWVLPTSGYHLTARFGESSYLWSSTHTGLDFATATGTPVVAATSGTVTFAGSAGAYGNKIEITHPDGSETWYCHLSRINVSVGTPVGTGALIGLVGATGNVTGPHLHFEVRPGGDAPVDPYTALVQHGVRP